METEEEIIEGELREGPPVSIFRSDGEKMVEWVTSTNAAKRLGLGTAAILSAVRFTREGKRQPHNQLRSIQHEGRLYIHIRDVETYQLPPRKSPRYGMAGKATAPRRAGKPHTNGHSPGAMKYKGTPQQKCFYVEDLTPELESEIATFLLDYWYTHVDCSATRLRTAVAAKFLEPDSAKPLLLGPDTLKNWLNRLIARHEEEERFRKAGGIDQIRARHIGIRTSILRRAMEDRDYISANGAANALAAYDGVAPELKRIEKSVQQMSEEELWKMLSAAVDGLQVERKLEMMKRAAIELSEEQWNELAETRGRGSRNRVVGVIEAGEGEVIAGLGDAL